MRKSVKMLMATLATIMIFISSSANAVYCDYCQGSGFWDCKPSYVVVDGSQTFSGQICTYFYSSGGGGGGTVPDSWFDFYEARAGGSFKFKVERKIPNDPTNSITATCASPQEDRFLHASRDVAVNNALVGGPNFAKAGSLAKVTYDDGGTEIWQVTSPLSSLPLMSEPVPNSLKCP